MAPARCPLPVTETGYASHFADFTIIAQAGGLLAYLSGKLDAAANSPNWRNREQALRQLTLF